MPLTAREMTVEEEIKDLHLEKTIEERILNKYRNEKNFHLLDKKDYEKTLTKQIQLIEAYRKILEDTIVYKWR